MTANRGAVAVIVVIVVALLGGTLFVAKPKFLHGDSRRAAKSTETTQVLVTATDAKAAAAAASVAKIAEVAATMPESKEKEFVVKEAPVAMALLPSPDPVALLEAERRKVAVLLGKVDEVDRLYGQATKKAESLQIAYNKALDARRAVDQELTVVAAERLGAERQRNLFIAVALLAVGLYVYAKVYGISLGTAGKIVADIRAGDNPIVAFDTNLAPWHHARVAAAAKLNTQFTP